MFISGRAQKKGAQSTQLGISSQNAHSKPGGVPKGDSLNQNEAIKATNKRKHTIIGDSTSNGLVIQGSHEIHVSNGTNPDGSSPALVGDSLRSPDFPITYSGVGIPKFVSPIRIASVDGDLSISNNLTVDGDFNVSGDISGVLKTTGDQSASGVQTFTNSTDATSVSAAAVVVNGGVGIAKSLHVGTTLTLGGTEITAGDLVFDPPGNDTEIVFNDAGDYGATTGFEFEKGAGTTGGTLKLTNDEANGRAIEVVDGDVNIAAEQKLSFGTDNIIVSQTAANDAMIEYDTNLTLKGTDQLASLTIQTGSSGGDVNIQKAGGGGTMTIQDDGNIILENDTVLSATSTAQILLNSALASLKLVDDAQLQVGTGADLTIKHDGTSSLIENTGSNLELSTNDGYETVIRTGSNVAGSNFEVRNQNNDLLLQVAGNGDTALPGSTTIGSAVHSGSEITGVTRVGGLTNPPANASDAASKAYVDSQGGVAGVDTYVQYNDGGAFGARAGFEFTEAVATGGTLTLQNTDASAEALTIVNGDIHTENGSSLKHSNDLTIGNGTSGSSLYLKTGGAASTLNFSKSTDAVLMTMDNAGKFTFQDGSDIETAGNCAITVNSASGYIQVVDNADLRIGSKAAGDLTITHDGVDSLITNTTNDLVIQSNGGTATRLKTGNGLAGSAVIVESSNGDPIITADGAGNTLIQTGTDTMGTAVQIANKTGTVVFEALGNGDTSLVGLSNPTADDHAANKAYVDAAAGVTPGGADTNVQYNDAGVLGGRAGFAFTEDAGTGGQLTLANSDVSGLALSVTDGDVSIADNSKLQIGTGNDMQISHNATDTLIENTTGNLIIDNTNVTGETNFQLGTDTSATAFNVQNDTGTDLFTVQGDGTTVIDGLANPTTANQAANKAYVDLVAGGGGVPGGLTTNVQYNDAGAFGGRAGFAFTEDAGTGGQLTLGNSDVSGLALSVTNGDISIVDNSKLQIGTGNDLQISHDATDTLFENSTGDLIIHNTNVTGKTNFQLGTDTSATAFNVQNDTGTDLFTVQGDGTTVIDGLANPTTDNQAANKAYVDAVAGGGGGTPGGADTYVQYNDAGAFGGRAGFAFTEDAGTGGQLTLANSDVSGLALSVTDGDVSIADNSKLQIGTGNDMQISHDATDTLIESATGNLVIDNTNVTGETNFRLGTDTSATSFNIQNNTGTNLFTVQGDGSANGVLVDSTGVTLGDLTTRIPLNLTLGTSWFDRRLVDGSGNNGTTVVSDGTTDSQVTINSRMGRIIVKNNNINANGSRQIQVNCSYMSSFNVSDYTDVANPVIRTWLINNNVAGGSPFVYTTSRFWDTTRWRLFLCNPSGVTITLTANHNETIIIGYEIL